MRHLERDLHGEFHKALVLAVSVPRGLVNKLLYAVFLYGVGVWPWMLQKILQKGSGGLGMAVQDVFTNEVFCAWLKEGPSGLLVHVEDYSFCIADGYCKVSFFYVVGLFHNLQR